MGTSVIPISGILNENDKLKDVEDAVIKGVLLGTKLGRKAT